MEKLVHGIIVAGGIAAVLLVFVVFFYSTNKSEQQVSHVEGKVEANKFDEDFDRTTAMILTGKVDKAQLKQKYDDRVNKEFELERELNVAKSELASNKADSDRIPAAIKKELNRHINSASGVPQARPAKTKEQELNDE